MHQLGWTQFALGLTLVTVTAVTASAWSAQAPAHPAMPIPPTTNPPTVSQADIERLIARRLVIPVQGVLAKNLIDNFIQPRDGGARIHEALDIPAARGTPVVAVEAGQIAKLFLSKPGGITLYQFDPTGEYTYFYGHLERYADGITEGMKLHQGQIIGYVGSSGNANPNAPHLHFAIFKLGPEKKWWKGVPLNPYTILRHGAMSP